MKKASKNATKNVKIWENKENKAKKPKVQYTNTATKSLARRKELYEAYDSLESQKKLFLM
jgi:CCR4-NOT transcriptional regulation complex NOT5 subunit